MELYFHPVSMTSRGVMQFIAENELPVEMKVVDLMTGEHYHPDFEKMNPNNLVPVLKDGDFILTESSSILKYLAEKHDLPSYPKDLQARARVNERMDWFNTQFYREYGYHLVYPQIFDHHKRPDEVLQKGTLEWGKERAEKAMRILNDHIIGDNDYVCGNELTVADFFGMGLVTSGDHIRVDFDKYPNVKRWLDTMRGMPKWNETHQVHEGFRSSLEGKDFVAL